jgi:hypothetical protein
MNFYETLARNLYTDNMKAEGGTILGLTQYIEYRQGNTDPVTFYSNILMAMSSPNVLMFRELKPELAWLLSRYCHDKLKDRPVKLHVTAAAGYNHFRELLRIPSELEFCLRALRTEPIPIINEDNNFLLGGKKKSALSGWVTALRLGFLKEDATNEDIARLIPSVIPNITITDRCLENTRTKAALRFANQISLRLRK